jgi:hypothetical protein
MGTVSYDPVTQTHHMEVDKALLSVMDEGLCMLNTGLFGEGHVSVGEFVEARCGDEVVRCEVTGIAAVCEKVKDK